ncbi:MAG: RNA-binding S4 domain-containing protein [Bacteroidales bacterium]|nr:RNA-binding S4 domain-containing protein [Bacteroidales bacterium]
MDEEIRIDKWLWSVRMFKTRSQASEACRSGKIRIQDQVVKPSRVVNEADVVSIHSGPMTKTLKVVKTIGNRVGAKIAVTCYEDLTPQDEYDKLKIAHETNYEHRQRGLGRPTKRERRMIERLKKSKF